MKTHAWRPFTLLLTACALAMGLGGCSPSSSLRADALSCEYRENPQGIATPKPRLAWKVRATDDAERGVHLSAYQIVAAASPQALDAGQPLLWDTGMISQQPAAPGDPAAFLPTSQIEYAGQPLKSRDRVWWKVRMWDQAGRDAGWSTPASFSVGLLNQSDWDADWIGLDDAPTPPLTAELREELRKLPWIRRPGPPERNTRVGQFSKSFTLGEGEVTEAFFVGTLDQDGAICLNNTWFNQMYRHDPVQPVDVKPALRPGSNTLWVQVFNRDGFNPAASGMLVIRFADKTEKRFPLDKSWEMQTLGPGPLEESRGQPWGSNRNTEHFLPRTPYLRAVFAPDARKSIAHATLYSTALGAYEAHLNGRRIGNDEFAPGWTEYSKRVYHQTYDVTNLIHSGNNCISVVLGDGWYAGLMGYTGKRRYYGGPARFKGQLEVEYTDGTRDTFSSEPNWVASFGPVLYTDNYLGSAYDATKEMPGWDTTDFDYSKWSPVATGLGTPTPRQADVTAKVRDLLKNKAGFTVNPKDLGDPAYGVPKTLTIDYTAAGKPKTLTFREGESVNFPRPGESADVAITKAVFSEPAALAHNFVIEPQPGEPVRRFEELPAKTVTKPEHAAGYIFDLGQNMVGWTRLRVKGHAGQKLTVRHAEMLNPDGSLYTSNLRGATATDFFTLKDGRQTLEPKFTFHGFRYVEVLGLEEKPDASMVTGIVVHTNMTPSGTFVCSNPLINQLVHNIVWGQKGNYLDIPTDCPQRDERLGWTGDAQFFMNAASYNFDISSFMSRWLKTLAHDAQFEDGTFAHVAPKVSERGGSTAWGDAAIVCTHAMYRTYADTRIIQDNWDNMAKYMAWLDSKTKDGIAKVGGFGDWVNLGDPTSPDLMDTAQRIQLLGSMADMARAINKPAEAAKYDDARKASIDAFRARFLTADGSLKESGQTGYALAFTIPGIIPDDMRDKAADAYVAAIEKKNWHLATGFIGTPRLLPGLYNANRSSTAERLLLNDDYPSWLYQVKLGATTMWERWDGWTPERGFQDVGMNSFNHYAFGSVGEALYAYIAGISVLEPGYKAIRIEPRVIPALSDAKATYDSINGRIESAWRKAETGVRFEIVVPPNTTALIVLPAPPESITESGKPLSGAAGTTITTGEHPQIRASSGRYVFEIKSN